MKFETIKAWGTRFLLGFVLISIGFALGKEITLRRLQSTRAANPPPIGTSASVPAATTRLRAYYLHGTIRCVTCNFIEATARQVLGTDFAKEMAAGRILWREVDFQQEPELAKRYDVAASTLVLVREVDGKETTFRRLDKVWEIADQPAALAGYIRTNVRELLP